MMGLSMQVCTKRRTLHDVNRSCSDLFGSEGALKECGPQGDGELSQLLNFCLFSHAKSASKVH